MKKMFVAITAILTATSAYADVGTRPSCADLGYDQTTAVCTGYEVLRCPFDQTKVFCKNPEPKTCEMGDILYSDKKCYDITPKTQTPIAVVIDPVDRYALALSPVSNEMVGFYDTMDEYNEACSNKTLKWDTGDENYGNMAAHPFTPYANYNSSTLTLFSPANSKTNIETSTSNYVIPTPKPSTLCTGDWFLPPTGIFARYHDLGNISKYNQINNGIQEAGGVPFFGTQQYTVTDGSTTAKIAYGNLPYHVATLPATADACVTKMFYISLAPNGTRGMQLFMASGSSSTHELKLSITNPGAYGALVRCAIKY